MIEPVDGKLPPLTAEAVALAEKMRGRQASSRSDAGTDPATYLDWSLFDRCVSANTPVGTMRPIIYGNSAQIVQTPDYVAIRYEMIHETRILPIKGRGADRPLLPYKLRG